MEVDFRGPLLKTKEPSKDEMGMLSLTIITGLCDHWEEVEPGLMRLYLK